MDQLIPLSSHHSWIISMNICPIHEIEVKKVTFLKALQMHPLMEISRSKRSFLENVHRRARSRENTGFCLLWLGHLLYPYVRSTHATSNYSFIFYVGKVWLPKNWRYPQKLQYFIFLVFPNPLVSYPHFIECKFN